MDRDLNRDLIKDNVAGSSSMSGMSSSKIDFDINRIAKFIKKEKGTEDEERMTVVPPVVPSDEITNIFNADKMRALAPDNIPFIGDRGLHNLPPPVTSPLDDVIRLLGATAPENIPCTGDMHDRGLHNLPPPVASLNKMGEQQSLDQSKSGYNPLGSANISDIQKIRDEFSFSSMKRSWEESYLPTSSVSYYDLWKRGIEGASRRVKSAEHQRDEALAKASSLQKEVDGLRSGPFIHKLTRISDLEILPVSELKQLQEQLKKDLEKIDKAVLYQTDVKCMVCEVRNRTITVRPCCHYVLCNWCALDQENCPYCHVKIESFSNTSFKYIPK